MDDKAIPRVPASSLDTNTTPVIDARAHTGHEQIRGALRYDPKVLLEEDKLTLPLPHESRIVVYSEDDERAQRVAARLREQGYEQVAILDGGFDAYRQAGLPTEEITQQQPVPGSESGIPRL